MTTNPRSSTLPGDLSAEQEKVRALRVDHAGEFGAVRIYEGQLSVIKDGTHAEKIRDMANQERKHLKIFESLLVKNKVRPTFLYPVWHVAGFAMGAGTALLGEKAAMACTVAVEEVIEKHYSRQISLLEDSEPELCEILSRCQEDEIEHRNISLNAGAEDAPGYPLLSSLIKTATRTAIWLSERI